MSPKSSKRGQAKPAAPAVHGHRSLIDAYIESPFAGIAPWVVMSLVSGPGRFEISVCAALFLSLATFAAGRRKGGSIKLMEVFDLLFFIGFAIVGLLASASTITWLETWAGEITNIALTLFVLITLAVRQPFTLQYAKETTDPSLWDNPVFLRINYTLTWVWAGAFAVQTISGGFGDLVLKDSDNFWTGWIIQFAALVFAFVFTEFYPEYAAQKAQGLEPPRKTPLLDWIPSFVLITGVAGLFFDAVPDLLGYILIIIGAIGLFLVLQLQKTGKIPK